MASGVGGFAPPVISATVWPSGTGVPLFYLRAVHSVARFACDALDSAGTTQISMGRIDSGASGRLLCIALCAGLLCFLFSGNGGWVVVGTSAGLLPPVRQSVRPSTRSSPSLPPSLPPSLSLSLSLRTVGDVGARLNSFGCAPLLSSRRVFLRPPCVPPSLQFDGSSSA